MRRTSPPNFRVCEPATLVKLSDHWKLLPTCGSSPSELLPITNPPEIWTKGTPSRVGPRFGVIPNRGLAGSLKQLPVGPVVTSGWPGSEGGQESVTLLVCRG